MLRNEFKLKLQTALNKKLNLFKLIVGLALTTLSFGSVVFLPLSVAAAHVQLSIWECQIPCEVSGTHQPLKQIRVTYCAKSVISQSMLDSFKPFCDRANQTTHAVAARVSGVMTPAICASSSNSCSTEGLIETGFTCSFLCPSEDHYLHKVSVCASNATDAWPATADVCKDAKAPTSLILPDILLCTADGQTACN